MTANQTAKLLDCAVLGTCTVDILVKPIDLRKPVGPDRLTLVDPISVTTGGVVSNSGMALARLGLRTAAVTAVGADDWASIIRKRLAAGGLDISGVQEVASQPTSSTVVLIDADGQRSFAHCPGACSVLGEPFFESQWGLLSSTKFVLVGYYSLLPELDRHLAMLFTRLREHSVLVGVDAAGSGGDSKPLREFLPFVDVYFPSFQEAKNQTGESDPRKMLEVFRGWGAPGILGVKLGADGVLVSLPNKVAIHLPALQPPGPILDTTGAGDAFFAGLIAGLMHGREPRDAARLGLAVAAYSITGIGASGALPTLSQADSLLEAN